MTNNKNVSEDSFYDTGLMNKNNGIHLTPLRLHCFFSSMLIKGARCFFLANPVLLGVCQPFDKDGPVQSRFLLFVLPGYCRIPMEGLLLLPFSIDLQDLYEYQTQRQFH